MTALSFFTAGREATRGAAETPSDAGVRRQGSYVRMAVVFASVMSPRSVANPASCVRGAQRVCSTGVALARRLGSFAAWLSQGGMRLGMMAEWARSGDAPTASVGGSEEYALSAVVQWL